MATPIGNHSSIVSRSPLVNGFVSDNPGRDVQRVGTARALGQDPAKIYEPVWGVVGNLGDSQCYLGVTNKVQAIHSAIAARISAAVPESKITGVVVSAAAAGLTVACCRSRS